MLTDHSDEVLVVTVELVQSHLDRQVYQDGLGWGILVMVVQYL
jgi:hypothetical protein